MTRKIAAINSNPLASHGNPQQPAASHGKLAATNTGRQHRPPMARACSSARPRGTPHMKGYFFN
jgi:hypothetical protein